MDTKRGGTFLWVLCLIITTASGQTSCPPPENIHPCICTHRSDDLQVWCTHSDLMQVSKGLQNTGKFITKELDEIIIENNYLPSLPGKLFQNVKILRLMLRNNGLERVSAAWLESQENNLLEIYIVENDLKSIPSESFMKLKNLQALTIRSNSLKRIPTLMNMPKLIYANFQSESFNVINEHTFENLPNLERLFIKGSLNLHTLKENAFYNLPKLTKLEITSCSINNIHMRALSLLPSLTELSLSDNKITEATMISRATRDLPMLSTINLNNNQISKLNEGAFVDQPMLETLYLENNNIDMIHHGAFHRVPKLRVVHLNHNRIVGIHPESFLQQSSSGVEELSLVGNKIMHISEFRSILDALPRLKFLDMSDNLLQEIPRGALRGHPNLEILRINENNIKFIQTDAFIAMPALRELHLNNNSLSDFNEGTFWNLPALKGLDLSNNYFRRLQPKLLKNLPALRRVNLSNNLLAIIDPLTFMESPFLEYVNISGNSLVSVHPATFRNLANLYEIDASSNRLIEFIPGLPRGIEQLYLKRNQIANLPMPPSPDMDLPSLRTLDISNNGIQKIPHGAMKTLHNVRRLYMKRNGLRQIETTTFNDLVNLEVLDLKDNQIISIHPKSFTELTHLKQVNLHGNHLQDFDLMAFQNSEALSILDLSKNKLKNLNPTTPSFSKALGVKVLNISYNNLYDLPTTLKVFSKLDVLDASNNHIKQLDENAINNMNTLTQIKIHSNKISELRPRSFQDLKNLESIDIENNNIESIHELAITNLLNLLTIYLGRNHIVDIPDKAFSNLPKLRILELQGNRLQFISMKAFDNVPLLQYLNLSNNQLSNLDNSGIRQLASLEVLDTSFNRLTRINKDSFLYMEWLVELNLNNNLICYISGQPFDFMPRLKVLSLQRNKLTYVAESTFSKLRNNIAILDIDDNPLICNCQIIWLKSWLLESSSIGPKCADGTHVKEMPFSRNDCLNYPVDDISVKTCLPLENEALQPNLATSQVFSTLDKIKDYETQIKNNYDIKNNNRPLPQESDYFYDEYVDYPYNETVIDSMNNEINQTKSPNKNLNHIGNTPTLYASMNNTENHKTNVALKVPSDKSGFTFFGYPLPSIDMGQLLGNGRKIDWAEQKHPSTVNKYPEIEEPKFETGGFSPMHPTTSSDFTPIQNPNMHITQPIKPNLTLKEASTSLPNTKSIKINETVVMLDKKTPTKISFNSSMHKKVQSEIHELEAYHNGNNKTHLAYNKTKNIQEQNMDPFNVSKYKLMESNITISEVTEKENIITTDSSDITLQEWLETSSAHPSTLSFNELKSVEKNFENQPSVMSSVIIVDGDILNKNTSRTATITKVNMPHAEHYDMRNNYSPVINREPKKFFDLQTVNTNVRHTENNDWYYENYNKSNLEPYIAPEVYASNVASTYCQPVILSIAMSQLLIIIIK